MILFKSLNTSLSRGNKVVCVKNVCQWQIAHKAQGGYFGRTCNKKRPIKMYFEPGHVYGKENQSFPLSNCMTTRSACSVVQMLYSPNTSFFNLT